MGKMSDEWRERIARMIREDAEKAKTLPVYWCNSQVVADKLSALGLRVAVCQKIPEISS